MPTLATSGQKIAECSEPTLCGSDAHTPSNLDYLKFQRELVFLWVVGRLFLNFTHVPHKERVSVDVPDGSWGRAATPGPNHAIVG